MKDIAKFLRKLRIDNEQSLGAMAKELKLSAAYLSAIENGKRDVPENFAERVCNKYSLDERQKKDIKTLVSMESNKVVIGLENVQEDNLYPEYVNTAVMFAQDLNGMNKHQLTKIQKLLEELKKEKEPM